MGDRYPDLLPLFLELCAIPSPPGRERAVADRVLRYLRDLGLSPDEDGCGPAIDGDTGNVYARIPATVEGGTPLVFCAHLDTVLPEGPMEPVVVDGMVRNAGGTILGADNKAAVVAMLEATRVLLAEQRPHAGVELVFTPREESGCDGAKAFDYGRLTARAGYVYDHAAPVGTIVDAAPFQRTLDVVYTGRKAHAGIAPEDGRSAILAAAKAIAELRLGRIDAETTANVGTIRGGTARNIVPDRCELIAECRSLDEAKAVALAQEMLDTFTYAATVCEVDVDVDLEEKYPGYRFRHDDPVLLLGAAALERIGAAPRVESIQGGADANIFHAHGIPCLVLANGMARIHTADEEIAVDDLGRMADVTLALVDLARERSL